MWRGKGRQEQFTALLHHVTVNLLRDSFYALKKNAAPGVDGVTWQEYETGLDERLTDLHSRIHRGTYRAQPSKRAYIPKADGRQRPLGIAALEDKIVQQAVVTVLNEIYEEDFLGSPMGSGLVAASIDALDALWVGMRKKVNWILDVDIQGLFRPCLSRMAGQVHRAPHRRPPDNPPDPEMAEGGGIGGREVVEDEVGTPQGAVASPLLANVYLHYVFDLWVEHWRKNRAG